MTTHNVESLELNGVSRLEDSQGPQTLMTPMEKPINGSGVPIIRVFGVGGAGCNAVARMFGNSLEGVDFYGINTDMQHLNRTPFTHQIPIGQALTRGLGSGGNPDLGRRAAEESRADLINAVSDADMVFLAAGMGGGTGTGAAPVLAQIAKESGALTIAVVSKPFSFESEIRRQNAEEGIARLKEHVDTVIVIPNDRLMQMEGNDNGAFTWDSALAMADSVLQQGIQAISEVITVPGEINVDFADVKAIMANAGPAWLAIGKAHGENRAVMAARMAVKSPLLDIVLEGAKRILFVITGGPNLTLQEVNDASAVIQEVADPEANIIFGTCKDGTMVDEVKVTLVASSFPILNHIQGVYEQHQEDLQRLLQHTPEPDHDDLDVPSFLRKQADRKKRGWFR